jgi:hypothetical protein
MAAVTLNGSSMWLAISRGCQQGGVLSPLLWCLVVDDLLARLSGGGVFIQEYTDDMCHLAVGKFPNSIFRTHAVGPFDRRDMVQQSWTVG